MPNTTIVAIGAITAVLILSTLKGIDGTLLASGLTLIAGLGGYAIGKAKSTKGKK